MHVCFHVGILVIVFRFHRNSHWMNMADFGNTVHRKAEVINKISVQIFNFWGENM